MQAMDGSTPTSTTATQASRLFPKTAAASVPQPAQRPAATGTASYHHPLLLCCLHAVVNITLQLLSAALTMWLMLLLQALRLHNMQVKLALSVRPVC